MRARIVRMGNSQGIRLPEPLLEQAGLADVIDLTAEAGRIVIAAARVARTGWAEAASRLQAAHEFRVEPGVAANFDETEWEWR